jgi:hypothetical protein
MEPGDYQDTPISLLLAITYESMQYFFHSVCTVCILVPTNWSQVKQWLTCCCIVYFELEAESISKHTFRKKELAAGTAISETLLELHN